MSLQSNPNPPKVAAGGSESADTLEALQSRLRELEYLEGRHGHTEAALRESELRYRVMYEENPSMYFTVDTEGTVLSVNPFGANQLGYTVPELVGQPVLEVFHPEDRESVKRQLRLSVDHPGKAFNWEFRKVHRDGRVLWVREVARAVKERDRIIVLIVCEDITSRRLIEDELRRARDEMELRVAERTAELERQRRFLRQIIDVDPNFIFAKDREGRFTLVNQAVAEAYGTTVEELIGRRDADFDRNPEQVESGRRIDREVTDTLTERFIAEEPFTDSKGRLRWFQTVKRPLKDDHGQVSQVLGSATDITARREIEGRLRTSETALRQSQQELQLLAGRLITAQEDERRRLAREMHDDLTQRVVGIAWQAARLERLWTSPSDEASALLAEIRGELAQLSTDVHALSRRLHPSILSDLGLVAVLELECKAFSEAGKIAVRFSPTDVPAEIDKDTAVCLYRITQEALRNVVKHAGTDAARVSLKGDAGDLVLAVEDHGVGFDAKGMRGVGLGLASMEERARLIRAEFTLDSRPGRGTTVCVRVPRDRISGSS